MHTSVALPGRIAFAEDLFMHTSVALQGRALELAEHRDRETRNTRAAGCPHRTSSAVNVA